jgi:hypothetical protein
LAALVIVSSIFLLVPSLYTKASSVSVPSVIVSGDLGSLKVAQMELDVCCASGKTLSIGWLSNCCELTTAPCDDQG